MALEIVAQRQIGKPNTWSNYNAVVLASRQYDAGTHETFHVYDYEKGLVYFKRLKLKEGVAPRAWFSESSGSIYD